MRKTVTRACLKATGACESGLALFDKIACGRSSVPVTLANVRRMTRETGCPWSDADVVAKAVGFELARVEGGPVAMGELWPDAVARVFWAGYLAAAAADGNPPRETDGVTCAT